MDRNLVVYSNHIDLGEEMATRELMRIVMDVMNRIAAWNGTGVQRSVVSAGTPTFVLLGHDVKCGGPRTLGAGSCAISQHVVDGVVTYVELNSSGASEVRKFGEDAVHWCTATDDFNAGNP
jgi:hypothetical protein